MTLQRKKHYLLGNSFSTDSLENIWVFEKYLSAEVIQIRTGGELETLCRDDGEGVGGRELTYVLLKGFLGSKASLGSERGLKK